MIYNDSPYNTGKDFIYRENFIDIIIVKLRYLECFSSHLDNALTNSDKINLNAFVRLKVI